MDHPSEVADLTWKGKIRRKGPKADLRMPRLTGKKIVDDWDKKISIRGWRSFEGVGKAKTKEEGNT